MTDGAAGPETRGRRADFERNLQRILDAATSILADDPNANMTEIADASGVVRATLYRHFPTRDMLLTAIFQQALEQADAAVAAAEPESGEASEALVRVVDAIAMIGDRYRILSTSNRMVALMDTDTRRRVRQVFEPVRAVIERGQREGTVRDDLSSHWIVSAIVALVNESARVAARGGLDPSEAGSVVRRTVLEALVVEGRHRRRRAG
jgi:AcrR family transcriptional regulator